MCCSISLLPHELWSWAVVLSTHTASPGLRQPLLTGLRKDVPGVAGKHPSTPVLLPRHGIGSGVRCAGVAVLHGTAAKWCCRRLQLSSRLWSCCKPVTVNGWLFWLILPN